LAVKKAYGLADESVVEMVEQMDDCLVDWRVAAMVAEMADSLADRTAVYSADLMVVEMVEQSADRWVAR
jgi:hypothetical protein